MWAIFGVLLAGLRFAIASYWINAYHGGFLPALGGALVAGAFPRLKARASFGHAVLLGTGCAILVGTRPFEGMFFVLPLVAMLAWQYRRRVAILAKIGLPVVVLVGMVVLGLGVYFTSVTGSPFVTAYQISRKAYGWPMTLEWGHPPAIQEPNIEFTRYYEYETGQRETVDGPLNMLEYLTFRMQEYWRFFLGPLLTVPLIMLGRVWRRRRELIFGVSGGIAAILLVGGGTPHYLAPATAMIIAIVVECCRYLSAARLRIPPLLLAAMALVLALRIGAQESGLPYTQKLNYQSWCRRVQGDLNKARITAELEKFPGQHLVFVRKSKAIQTTCSSGSTTRPILTVPASCGRAIPSGPQRAAHRLFRGEARVAKYADYVVDTSGTQRRYHQANPNRVRIFTEFSLRSLSL